MAQTKKQKEIVAWYTTAIEKGVAVLDKELGRNKWLKKIDLELLDLKDASVCICGQVFGSFWGAVFKKSKVKLPYSSWVMSTGTPQVVWAAEHGFATRDFISTEFAKDYSSFDILTHLWYIKVAQLKIEAGLMP